jgi:protein-S-isoprenylcysteine O-methyltransferase Ste14
VLSARLWVIVWLLLPLSLSAQRINHAGRILVVSGIYRRTRNPMYLGFLLGLAGWGFSCRTR